MRAVRWLWGVLLLLSLPGTVLTVYATEESLPAAVS